jgi:flagellar biosynthesis GTPase FlhF
MPAPKKSDASPDKSATPDLPKVSDRKPWKKKTPVEVVLEQADKLKEEIAEAEEDLKAKRRQLEKFEQAKKLFEGA